MDALLLREGRDVIYRDRTVGRRSGRVISVTWPRRLPLRLAARAGVAGEAVWREATGKGFALDIVRDPEALLGYRLRGIGDGSFTTVMLATMEATAQVARPGAIVVNDLNALWAAATDRIERSVRDERDTRSMPGEGSGRGSDSVRGKDNVPAARSVPSESGAAPRSVTGAAP